MSEKLFDSVKDQKRVRGVVSGVTQLIFAPTVQAALGRGTPRQDWGWGLLEYRSGADFLTNIPHTPGERPVEAAFYPTLPNLGVEGGVFWHGEGSKALACGRVVGLYLDNTCEDGRFVNYVRVRTVPCGLEIGHTIDDTEELRPPTEAFVTELEIKLDDLNAYVQTI